MATSAVTQLADLFDEATLAPETIMVLPVDWICGQEQVAGGKVYMAEAGTLARFLGNLNSDA